MPILKLPTYNPPLYLKNGHINTLYTYLYRKSIDLTSSRVRQLTFDNDFVDVDYVKNGNNEVVLLLHGLEGSSESQYMKGAATYLSQHGYDIAMLNHRSCSGELNNNITMYHSGFTQDIHLMVELLSDIYDKVHLVGFSMGGNMALKYVGDHVFDLNKALGKVVGVSVPVDLASSSHKLTHWTNVLYERNFLGTLKQKVKEKQLQFPDKISSDDIKKITSLVTFDDYFTGPIHGFKDSADYYDKSNALQFLTSLRRKSLLINSIDDPFLTPSCFPVEIAKQSSNFYFGSTKYGGHVGFYQKQSNLIFVDDLILNFLQN